MTLLASLYGLTIGALLAWLDLHPGQFAFWLVLAIALGGFRWWWFRRRSTR